MSAVDVIIVVDNKVRDLAGCFLLKKKLEEIGITARLSPNGHEYEMLFFRPKAILHNHMREAHKTKIGRLQKKIGVQVIVTPTENIMRENRDVMQLYLGKFWCEFDLIDLFLCWGEAAKEVLVNDCGMKPEKVIPVGHYRSDLFFPPFNYKRNITGLKTVLYASSHHMAGWSREKALAILKGTDFDKLTSFTVEEYFEEDYKALFLELEAMREAIKRYPHINFILKPHPHENFETYDKFKEEMKEYSNFRIEKETHFNKLINEVDLLIHSSSMASIESWFAGVPTICLWFFERKSCYYPELRSGSIIARYPEELLKYLGNFDLLKKDFSQLQNNRDKYVKRWLTAADGKRCEAIAEKVKKQIINHPAPSSLKIFYIMVQEYGLKAATKHYLRYWRRGRNNNFIPYYTEKQKKHLGKDVIEWEKRKVFTDNDLREAEIYISNAYANWQK